MPQLPGDYKAALVSLAFDDANAIKRQAGWIQRLVMRGVARLIDKETEEPVRTLSHRESCTATALRPPGKAR